jgi:hypothetical protein
VNPDRKPEVPRCPACGHSILGVQDSCCPKCGRVLTPIDFDLDEAREYRFAVKERRDGVIGFAVCVALGLAAAIAYYLGAVPGIVPMLGLFLVTAAAGPRYWWYQRRSSWPYESYRDQLEETGRMYPDDLRPKNK